MDFLRKALPTGAKALGRYLEGVRFPIRKEELVSRLERNGVPGSILSQARKRLPERKYRGPQDVLDALCKGRWRRGRWEGRRRKILGGHTATGRRRNMPEVRIEVREGRSASKKKALLEAVHSALVEALKIPEHDRIQRLYELSAEDFEIPSDRTEMFTLIEVTIFPGRSLNAKRALYGALVRNLGGLGVPPNDVFVILREPPMENWGIRGVAPASEVDLGFEVEV